MIKNKEVIRRTLFSVLVFLITALVCFAVFLPTNIGNILETVAEPVKVCQSEDIILQVNCNINSQGEYVINDSDPQLLFNTDCEITCIELVLQKPVSKALSLEVYTAIEDNSFSAEMCYRGCVFSGETSAVIDIPEGDYSLVRVDIDGDDGVFFKNVSMYAQEPEAVPYTPKHTVSDYLITIIVPVVFAVTMFFADVRFKLCEQIAVWFKKNRFKLATVAVFTALSLLVAVLAELLISGFLNSGTFNEYRMVFIAGAIGVVFIFLLGYKSLREKPENLFLGLVLVLGCTMLFSSPIKHICWDLDSHYPWAVQASFLDTAYYTNADNNIDNIGIESMVSAELNYETYKSDIEHLNAADEMLVSEKEVNISFAHLPSGIVMAVARLFGATFSLKYNLGRLAYLLIYSFVCYFAIKKLKSGKMILATICLFPTCLFLATNYAYDFWVTGFSILGIAYYASEIQEPNKPIKVKDTVIMCASFALSALPKLIYIILMGIPLFMHKKWTTKKEKRTYYIILITMFAIVFAMFVVRSLGTVTGTGDARGGDVNPAGQISFILSQPLAYAKILFNFLAQYLSIGTMGQYISNFAYLGIGNKWFIMVVLLAFTALTDSNASIKFKIPIIIKICSVLLFVGMAMLITTALYIDFTPVGNSTILGCQPRYIIPLLAPLLLLVTGQRLNLIKNKAVYNAFVLGVSSLVVLMETYSQIVRIMI